ncbi:MAG TPA: ABC transporter ATP-binding protein [Clostridia bacterium]|nr:ABC transporter ATP-binding protein [Clostridia bacterium]
MNKIKKPIKKQKLLRTLAGCIGEYKRPTLITPIFVVLEAVLEVLIPILMAQIVNVGMSADLSEYALILEFGSVRLHLFTLYSRIDFVVAVGGMMAVMATISLVFGALAGRFSAVAATGFGKNVRKNLFYKVQDFSFFNMDKFNTASLLTRLTTDVTNVQNAFMMFIRILLRAPIMLTLAILMAVSINADLALIFLAVLPILLVSLAIIASLAFSRFNAMLKKYDDLNEKTQEDLIGIRVVKSFVREDYETKRFKQVSSQAQKLQLRAEKLLTSAMPIMQLSMYACLIAVAWFGGNQIIVGGMQLGSFMAFISYVMTILISFMMLAFMFVMLVLSKSSAVRIVDVLNEEIDIKDSESTENISVENGSVVFSDVNFSYNKNPDNLHLSGINLEIKSGEKIGIIGGTGSSKSTLVQLIPRLYDVTSGKILVGGRDVRDYKLDNLRNSVAMVLQKNVLFSGTIKENLKWGNENATDEQIFEAAKAAQAHDFIMSFPDGYETYLGQGGVNVSGGQKQRLCIARALLKNPKIMILDDSTSAVDTATDSKIREQFRKNLSHMTVFVIAQRVTSVADADRIIVLDDGKISAIGTHKQLLKSNEIYQEVYNIQKQGVK